MRVASADYASVMSNNVGVFHKVTLVNGSDEYTANGFTYQDLISSDGLSIGNTSGGVIQFNLVDVPYYEVEGREFEVRDVVRKPDGTFSAPLKLGLFTVLEASTDKSVTKCVAYDRMVSKLQYEYTFPKLPTTCSAVMADIVNKTGITWSCPSFTDYAIDDGTIEKSQTGMTYRTAIGYIAQMQGKNARFDSTGVLRMSWYTDTDYQVDDTRIYMEGNDSENTIYELRKITNVRNETWETQNSEVIEGETITNTEYHSEEKTFTAGAETGNGIVMNNPFITQAILNDIWNKIGGFTYAVQVKDFVGDFRIESGDVINVGNNTLTKRLAVMSVNHTSDGGLVTTTSSFGGTEASANISNEGSMSKAINYLKELIADKATFQELNATNAHLGNVEAKSIRTESLVANKADINLANIDTANINVAKVGDLFSKVGIISNLQVQDEKITGTLTGVKIIGDSIQANTIAADALIIKDSESGLAYKLNALLGNLTAEQLTEEEYQKHIDGSVLVAKSVTADEINTDTLIADTAFIDGLASSKVMVGAVTRSIALGTRNLVHNSNTLQWDGYELEPFFVIGNLLDNNGNNILDPDNNPITVEE